MRLLRQTPGATGRRHRGAHLAVVLALSLVGACSAVPDTPSADSPPRAASTVAPAPLPGTRPPTRAPLPSPSESGRPEQTRPAEGPLVARVAVSALPSLPHDASPQEVPYRVIDADVHLDVVVPQLKSAPVANRQLRRIADGQVRSFRQEVRQEASRPGRYHALSVGWQLVGRSRAVTGIQLWVASQHGLRVGLEPFTVWYDHRARRLLTLQDLITPAAWPGVRQAIKDAAVGAGVTAATVESQLAGASGTPPRVTFGFTADGSLVVTFAPSRRGGTRPVSVRLATEPLKTRLSGAGRAAQRAGKSERGGPDRPKSVDCTEHRCVALTFDDGPGPYTAELVSILKRHDVPATFFLVGDRVRLSPETVAVIHAAGLEVGNHTSHHDELTREDSDDLRRDLTATSDEIAAITGRRPTLLRPPYGSRNHAVDAVSKQLGMAEVLWDVDTLDWRYPDPVRVRRAAVEPTRRGSIILMHDIHRTSVAAVPQIITDLQRRGFTLVSAGELLGGRPVPGRVYRRAGR